MTLGDQLQDSLIAFIRAAQLELVWIHEREDIEVTRNWSDISQLDLPMLQNYFRQVGAGGSGGLKQHFFSINCAGVAH